MLECGWIIRNGDFVPCQPGKHSEVAKVHFPYAEDPEQEASKVWVKVAKNITDGQFCIGFYRPSKAQLTSLYEWCIAHNYPYPL